MFKIATWHHNHQAPVVLMIDDLSDAYIDAYPESYKNDWGYLCDLEGSSYHFLQQELLQFFPDIKITFFVPYLRHGILNENCPYPIQKYAVGERTEYRQFLQKLISHGHEMAHHGSDHGHYINPNQCTVGTNWIHEWGVFETVEAGVKTTLKGVEIFKQVADIDIVGGKYCGYLTIHNSQEIIEECDFLYWCVGVNYLSDDMNESYFGRNNTLAFPTNFAGNSFVRLSYPTGDARKDRIKKFMQYFQPFYNFLSYYKLRQLYNQKKIISIQEHISPSTTWGLVQSSNIITDIVSLKKIFAFLRPLSIWYATCAEIATYVYVKNNTTLLWDTTKLTLNFTNTKKLSNITLSITHPNPFVLRQNTSVYHSNTMNHMHTVSVPLLDGENVFEYIIESKK
jgi:hypothetical protein